MPLWPVVYNKVCSSITVLEVSDPGVENVDIRFQLRHNQTLRRYIPPALQGLPFTRLIQHTQEIAIVNMMR